MVAEPSRWSPALWSDCRCQITWFIQLAWRSILPPNKRNLILIVTPRGLALFSPATMDVSFKDKHKEPLMKKWLAILMVSVWMASAVQAGIGAFGSWWDSKDYEELYGGGVRIGLGLPAGFGVEARASYLSNDLLEDRDVAMNVIPLEAVASLTLQNSSILEPYIGAGVGYYLKNVDVDSSKFWEKSEDCLGYFALAGLNITFVNVTLFGEAKYNLISEKDKLEWRGTDIREKYSLDGLSVNVGLKIGF